MISEELRLIYKWVLEGKFRICVYDNGGDTKWNPWPKLSDSIWIGWPKLKRAR